MLRISRELNKGALHSTGYWYKGYVLYPIYSTHIRAVLDYPQLFKTDKESLLKEFRKHHEKIGFEGKARREIIEKLLGAGWVRIRHYRGKGEYWSFQYDSEKMSAEVLEYLLPFMRENQIIKKDEVVKLNGAVLKRTNRYYSMRIGYQMLQI